MRAGIVPGFKHWRLCCEGDLNAYIRQIAEDGKERNRERARLGGLALKAKRDAAKAAESAS